MDGVTLIGWAGSALVIAMFVPQFVRTWRYGPQGQGLTTPAIGGLATATWAAYGLLRHDPIIVSCNALACLFACGIVAGTLRRRGGSVIRTDSP